MTKTNRKLLEHARHMAEMSDFRKTAMVGCIVAIKSKVLSIGFNTYVYRLRRDQPYGLAAPCPACSQFMKDLWIKLVYRR